MLIHKIPTWTLQVGAGVIYFFADILCKKFATTPTWQLAIYLQLMYIIVSFAWLGILIKENSLVVQGIIWSTIVVGLSIIVGKFIFHEVITPHQLVGITFGIVAIILMSI